MHSPSAPSTPEDIVYRFLQALAERDHDQVAALLAPDLRYTNVSLPTLRGGEFVARLLRRVLSGRRGFDVQVHSIASNGTTVLTERTDVLILGPLHMRFWVCGTFLVEQGRITLWRDYFDWWDLDKGSLRGVLGIALPRLRSTLPAQPGQ